MFGDAGVLTVRFRLWAEILQNIGGKSNAGVSVQSNASGRKTGAVLQGREVDFSVFYPVRALGYKWLCTLLID